MNGDNGDGNGDRNGEGQKAWTEQDQKRRGREAGASVAGNGVRRPKSNMLVGDVLEYWSF